MMDSNLTWKQHILELTKKISRSIGVLCKLRHFVPPNILTQIYYSIIFPFLTYGVVIWGNNYPTNLYPLVTIQKRAIRILSFSHFQAHTTELFKKFNLLKVMDIIKLYTAIFMHQFHNGILPKSFNNFFTPVCTRHQYNTRLASKLTFSLPQARTNYGLFNIRFSGPKLWNSIDEILKSSSVVSFKKIIQTNIDVGLLTILFFLFLFFLSLFLMYIHLHQYSLSTSLY